MAATTPEGKGGASDRRVVKCGRVRHSRARMERGDATRAPARIDARPHVIHFAGATSWAAFVAFVVTLLIRHNDLPASTDWRIVGGGVLVALAGAIAPAARWLRTRIEIDTARARCTSGLVRQTTVDLALDRARGVVLEQSLLGRWLGYGRLRVVDDAGAAHLFPPLGDVDALRDVVGRRDRRFQGRRGERREG